MNKAQSLLITVAQDLCESDKHYTFIYPQPDSALITFAKAADKFTAVETFYPGFIQLKNFKLDVTNTLSFGFENVLFLGGRLKANNLKIFETVLTNLKDGKVFLCCMPNDLGASRFEKELQNLYQDPIFSVQKSKCRAFGIQNFDPDKVIKDNFKYTDASETIFGEQIFNQGKLDQGSSLLLETIADKISGKILEPCCGLGALSKALLNAQPSITKLIGIEADFSAVESAKKLCIDSRAEFIWGDSTKSTDEKFAAIVLNPPFHSKSGTDKNLGISCIKAAIDSLAANGILYVVQNEFLPYRKELGIIDTSEIISKDKGFIVWCYKNL